MRVMKSGARMVSAGAFYSCCMLLAASSIAAEPAVTGWIEYVWLGNERVVVQAKIDTGADVSSLHATNIRRIQRDGVEWVSFDLTDEDDRVVHFERQLVRNARVRSAAGGRQQRPVVRIEVCLGPVSALVEVNLVDRSAMSERMLIGRSFLRGRFLVDSARTHVVNPSCAGKS